MAGTAFDKIMDPFNYTGWNAAQPYQIDYASQPQAPQMMDPTKVPLDESGLNAFRTQAERTGPSTWANEATAKSYGDQAASADALSKKAMSDTATSDANLAMTGGLRSGAAERVQTSGNRNAMVGMQGLAQQGNANREQIGMNDEQNRITQLGMLPGMETQNAQFKVGAEQAQNQNLQQQFQTQSGMWGAAQQGNATQAAAMAPKRGTWICTESKKMASSTAWSGPDADALGEFRHYAMKKDRALTAWYIRDGKGLIDRMHAAQDVNWPRMLFMVQGVIALVKAGKMKTAHAIFKGTIHGLVVQYWPEMISHTEDL